MHQGQHPPTASPPERALHRRAISFVVSDFLAPLENYQTALTLAGRWLITEAGLGQVKIRNLSGITWDGTDAEMAALRKDLDAAAKLLLGQPRVRVRFHPQPEGRITDFHFEVTDDPA